MSPRILLHVEGGMVFLLSTLAYGWNHGSWLQFVLLFLVPDFSMIGYLSGGRVGAFTYNLVHTYVGPLLLAAYGFSGPHRLWLLLSLIWIAHIGIDRMLGYGLKYSTQFKDTHLNPARHALETLG